MNKQIRWWIIGSVTLLALVFSGASIITTSASAQAPGGPDLSLSGPATSGRAQVSKIASRSQQVLGGQSGAVSNPLVPTGTPTCPPVAGRIVGAPGKAGLAKTAANSPLTLSASKRHGSIPAANADLPDGPAEFGVDDGAYENMINFGNNGNEQAGIWLNRFSPPSGAFPITLQGIRIMWPNDNVGESLVGKMPTLLVYQDADGDGNPDNATLLMTQTVTIGGLDTFETYPVNVPITGSGDIYVGFEDTWAEGASGYYPPHRPAALDMTNSQVRSWAAASAPRPNLTNLGANSSRGYMDAFGVPSNFMIRAFGTTLLPGGCPQTPTITPTRTVTNTPTDTPTATPTFCPPVTFHAGGLPRNIPDPGTLTSALNITGLSGPIYDLDVVDLNIEHSGLSDLRVSLTSPQGTTVLLINRICTQFTATNAQFNLNDQLGHFIGYDCPPVGVELTPRITP